MYTCRPFNYSQQHSSNMWVSITAQYSHLLSPVGCCYQTYSCPPFVSMSHFSMEIDICFLTYTHTQSYIQNTHENLVSYNILIEYVVKQNIYVHCVFCVFLFACLLPFKLITERTEQLNDDDEFIAAQWKTATFLRWRCRWLTHRKSTMPQQVLMGFFCGSNRIAETRQSINSIKNELRSTSASDMPHEKTERHIRSHIQVEQRPCISALKISGALTIKG